MPDGMKFPTNAELWTPFIPTRRAGEARTTARSACSAGCKHAIPRAQAQTEMNGIAGRLAAAVSRHEQGLHARPRRDLQRALQRRSDPGRVPRDDGRRRLRAAHRVRERRQPAAVALGASLARDCRPHRARRDALAGGPAAAGRERRARLHRRRARAAARARRRPPVRRRGRRTSASRTGSSSRWTTSSSASSRRSAC